MPSIREVTDDEGKVIKIISVPTEEEKAAFLYTKSKNSFCLEDDEAIPYENQDYLYKAKELRATRSPPPPSNKVYTYKEMDTGKIIRQMDVAYLNRLKQKRSIAFRLNKFYVMAKTYLLKKWKWIKSCLKK